MTLEDGLEPQPINVQDPFDSPSAIHGIVDMNRRSCSALGKLSGFREHRPPGLLAGISYRNPWERLTKPGWRDRTGLVRSIVKVD